MFILGIYQIRVVCASKVEKRAKKKGNENKMKKIQKGGACHPLGVWSPPPTLSVVPTTLRVAPSTKKKSGTCHSHVAPATKPHFLLDSLHTPSFLVNPIALNSCQLFRFSREEFVV